ncbi:hypothetical protein HPB52_010052 [Rhipicephalus sanguineus]|uniref:Uncharacterized protein n=1 Tax=Rhipicephalus sanguineus TaxID=34632 RepID=A0A9D4T443_RHISA|nr:hypothetical protein HPB52_010052 [Rhipicephalus sanguineus]
MLDTEFFRTGPGFAYSYFGAGGVERPNYIPGYAAGLQHEWEIVQRLAAAHCAVVNERSLRLSRTGAVRRLRKRFIITERGYPQVEELETIDLPRPSQGDSAGDRLRACVISFGLLFMFGGLVATAILVYGSHNLFGNIKDETTDVSQTAVIYW